MRDRDDGAVSVHASRRAPSTTEDSVFPTPLQTLDLTCNPLLLQKTNCTFL